MKTIILPTLAALALSTPALAEDAAEDAPLTIEVRGVEDRGGRLYVGVQTEAQFLQEDGVAGRIFDDPDAGSLRVSFPLPEGRYAVSVWHDDDADGEFDRAENGMPLDGWAMSNDAGRRGPPSFDDAAVELRRGGAETSATMIYPERPQD